MAGPARSIFPFHVPAAKISSSAMSEPDRP